MKYYSTQGPWGGKSEQEVEKKLKAVPKQNPPSFLDAIQKKIKEGMGNNGNGSNQNKPGLGLAALVLVLFVVWGASSSVLIVGPDEEAVVLRFGQHVRNEGSGFKLKFPAPIETAKKVKVTQQRTTEIGGDNVNSRRKRVRSSKLKESLMLTGDENIFDINFVVQWVIKDGADYLFNVDNPDATVKKVAESSMREVVAQTKVAGNSLTDHQRLEIGVTLEKEIQTILDSYETGIEIKRVEIGKGDPPEQVIEKFRDVQTARNEANRYRQEGEAYRNKTVPLARGEAEKIIQKAEAYKQEVVERARGEADRFNSVYQEYALSKEVTKQRIYLETMEKVMGKANKTILDSDSGVVPYLPLNQLKQER